QAGGLVNFGDVGGGKTFNGASFVNLAGAVGGTLPGAAGSDDLGIPASLRSTLNKLRTAPGFLAGRFANIQDIRYGGGFNVLLGTNAFPSLPEGISKSKLQNFAADAALSLLDGSPGANTFQVTGPGSFGSAIAALKEVKNARDTGAPKTSAGAQGVQELVKNFGVHVLEGFTGGDTYSFDSIWGFGIVPELPDININGTAIPEFFDTLDFSGVGGDLNIRILEANDDQANGFFEQLGSVLGTGLTFGGFGGVVTSNIVLVEARTPILESLIPNVELPGFLGTGGYSWVMATDIENIIGSSGLTTIEMVGNASLRGTVTAPFGGSVVLDYSRYNSQGEGVQVDAGAGIDIEVIPGFDIEIPAALNPFSDTDIELWEVKGVNYRFGSASGISGYRLGGLEEWVDGLFPGDDTPISDFIGDFAVSRIGKIIGTPSGDRLIGVGGENIFTGSTSGEGGGFFNSSGNDFFIGFGGDDLINGKGGIDTVSFAFVAATESLVIDLRGPDLSRGSTIFRAWQGVGIDSSVLDFDDPDPGLIADLVADGTENLRGSAPGNLFDPAQRQAKSQLIEIENIVSGQGNDLIVGGSGANTYIFDQPWGRDVIVDDNDNPNVKDFLDFTLYDGTIKVMVLGDRMLIQGTNDNGDVLLDGGGLVINQVVAFGVDELRISSTSQVSNLSEVDGSILVAEEFKFESLFTKRAGSGLAGEAFTPGEAGAAIGYEDLEPVFDEAVSRWSERAGLPEGAREALEGTIVVLTDLAGNRLAEAQEGILFIDADGAGVGWYLGGATDEAAVFAAGAAAGSLVAGPDSPAYGRYDLLTVLTHELGHQVGLGHAAQGGRLMGESLAPGVRKSVDTTAAEFAAPAEATIEAAVDGDPLSDEEKLVEGLTGFADWAAGFGDRIRETASQVSFLPFLDDALGDLWDVTGAQITDQIALQVRDRIVTAFQAPGELSNLDLLAVDGLEVTLSSELKEYRGQLSLFSYEDEVTLSLDTISFGDVEVGLPFEVVQSRAIDLRA
ncbi:MAG: hypothetical protein ACC661_06005, partial [Verrucomicrobiales bacterium]